MSDEQTLAVYDAKAKEYAALVAKSEPDAALIAFMAATMSGGLVLDLGCGVANASAMMRVPANTGSDSISHKMGGFLSG